MQSILLVLFFISSSTALFGFPFGRQLSKNQCPIKLYHPKDSSFTGVKLYTNTDTFHPLLDILSDYAQRCRVRINVKRAFTNPRTSLFKFDDRLPMAFQLGEAIEYDLVDQHDRPLCNRACLGRSLSQMKTIPGAKCFIRKIKRNHDFERDPLKPMILMKRNQNKNSLFNEDQQKILQKKCENLDLS